MSITENQELIINIDGKTQCISRKQIENAFSELKASCANYEKDNVDPIVEAVKNELDERSNRGINKYGVLLTRDDLSLKEWVKHAREEAEDLSLYLMRIEKMLKNGK